MLFPFSELLVPVKTKEEASREDLGQVGAPASGNHGDGSIRLVALLDYLQGL